MTRQELANKMGVSKNTISLIVEELMDAQLLREVTVKEAGTKGRPKSNIEFNNNIYKSIGFFISLNTIEYTVIDYSGKQIENQKIEFNGKNPTLVMKKIACIIKELIERYDKVLGIGIGIPGIVNVNTRTIYESTHLGWKNVIFEDKLFSTIDVPVFVQNSVKMGTLYAIEKEGDQEKISSFYVRVGEGVGGAYIINNTIMNGGSWTAGEIGHISIDPEGEICKCGQRGCLELLINKRAFLKKMNELEISENLYVTQSHDLYQPNSRNLDKLMTLFGSYLGKALVQVVHLINPSQIFIDTPYNSLDSFSKSCLKYMEKNALEVPYEQTKVIFSNERYNLSNGAALSVIVNYEKFVF